MKLKYLKIDSFSPLLSDDKEWYEDGVYELEGDSGWISCSDFAYKNKKQIRGDTIQYPSYMDNLKDGFYLINSLSIVKWNEYILIFNDRDTFESSFNKVDYFNNRPTQKELDKILSMDSKYLNKHALHIIRQEELYQIGRSVKLGFLL